MKRQLMFATLLAATLSAGAQVTIDIDAQAQGVAVSPTLYGIFFEEINHAGDGGLYAELIRNRSFEDSNDGPEAWSVEEGKGTSVTATLVGKGLLNDKQHQALQLDIKAAKSADREAASLVNEGFWGINAVQGRTYKLSFWAKGNYKGRLSAVLRSEKGDAIYAETEVGGKVSGKWTKFTATMTSRGNDPKARFALVADGSGQLTLDMVSLFPPTFKNRENGCRPDLAQMLLALHPTFMRFPGGCYVEGQDTPDNAFRWERTIGPIEEREGHLNRNWNYRVSDGLGFHEMLQLSEDLGAKPLFVVNVGIWHGGFTPLDSIQPWIDECLNALEYANGPVSSKYGALRAKNGHPAPFNIEYLEIGNENNQPNQSQQSDHYYERYKKFQDAILAKYPNMHCIGNVAAWGTDNPKWQSDVPCELLDEHYYRSPAWFASQFHKYDDYERGRHGIYVGEYAVTQGYGTFGHLNAALGEAIYMMGMENNSDVVCMASYAPIFVNENNAAWSPDMIRFNSERAIGTPSYYVQKLMAEHVGTRMLRVTQTNPYKDMDLTQTEAPKPVRMGAATWATQASYKDASVTIDGQTVPLSGWTGQRGRWTMGETVAQTGDGQNCVAVAADQFSAKKLSYSIKARKDGGREGVMVVFNYTDLQNFCWLNIGGWDNSQSAIEQTLDGGKTSLVGMPGHVETGRWYDIRIDIDGDSIACFLDGQFLMGTRLKTFKPEIYSNASIDEATGETIVKIVNMNRQATTARINLNGLSANAARVIRLTSAKGTDENSISSPTNVYPTEETLSPADGSVLVTVPAFSLNIVRVK